MRILLDECLPRRLVRDFPEHQVTTVPREGWAGKSDFQILTLIGKRFDVFLTLDSNLEAQQNLRGASVGVLVLNSANSRYETIQALLPNVRAALRNIEPGKIVRVGSHQRR